MGGGSLPCHTTAPRKQRQVGRSEAESTNVSPLSSWFLQQRSNVEPNQPSVPAGPRRPGPRGYMTSTPRPTGTTLKKHREPPMHSLFGEPPSSLRITTCTLPGPADTWQHTCGLCVLVGPYFVHTNTTLWLTSTTTTDYEWHPA